MMSEEYFFTIFLNKICEFLNLILPSGFLTRFVRGKPLHSQPKPVFLMKNINTVLNIIALVGVAVLFFLFSKGTKSSNHTSPGLDSGKVSGAPGSIAYFEMDTVEQHYNYIKDITEELKQKEQGVSNDLNATKKNYMNRIQQLQSQAANMNQQQGEAAQAEINQMQVDIQQKEARLSQELQEHKYKLMQDIQKKIEDFLKVYNQDKKYAYILSHQTGDFIYFKDSVNNITADVIKGLNDGYKKPEKK
jgi:outer membrane protein